MKTKKSNTIKWIKTHSDKLLPAWYIFIFVALFFAQYFAATTSISFAKFTVMCLSAVFALTAVHFWLYKEKHSDLIILFLGFLLTASLFAINAPQYSISFRDALTSKIIKATTVIKNSDNSFNAIFNGNDEIIIISPVIKKEKNASFDKLDVVIDLGFSFDSSDYEKFAEKVEHINVSDDMYAFIYQDFLKYYEILDDNKLKLNTLITYSDFLTTDEFVLPSIPIKKILENYYFNKHITTNIPAFQQPDLETIISELDKTKEYLKKEADETKFKDKKEEIVLRGMLIIDNKTFLAKITNKIKPLDTPLPGINARHTFKADALLFTETDKKYTDYYKNLQNLYDTNANQ